MLTDPLDSLINLEQKQLIRSQAFWPQLTSLSIRLHPTRNLTEIKPLLDRTLPNLDTLELTRVIPRGAEFPVEETLPSLLAFDTPRTILMTNILLNCSFLETLEKEKTRIRFGLRCLPGTWPDQVPRVNSVTVYGATTDDYVPMGRALNHSRAINLYLYFSEDIDTSVLWSE